MPVDVFYSSFLTMNDTAMGNQLLYFMADLLKGKTLLNERLMGCEETLEIPQNEKLINVSVQ